MIVMCNLTQYGVKGKMIEELHSFLKENVNDSFVENMEGYVQVKRNIRKKLQELQAKYPKTKPLSLEGYAISPDNNGSLKFMREGASVAVISMQVLWVRKCLIPKQNEGSKQ